jgi:hypothetical protein
MSELAVRKFRVMRNIREPPVKVEARSFKDFMEKTSDRSRTETVRALRKGKAFFIEGEKPDSSSSKAESFGRINVALEAFRNMSESEENSCLLHVLTHDNAQMSFSLLPKKDGLTSSEVRNEFAKDLNELVSQGTILVLTGSR